MPKADELNYEADPIQGTTCDILYSINRTYIQPEGIGQNMKYSLKGENFEQLVGLFQKYGKVILNGGPVIRAIQC